MVDQVINQHMPRQCDRQLVAEDAEVNWDRDLNGVAVVAREEPDPFGVRNLFRHKVNAVDTVEGGGYSVAD
jgi:hypothetical protein